LFEEQEKANIWIENIELLLLLLRMRHYQRTHCIRLAQVKMAKGIELLIV